MDNIAPRLAVNPPAQSTAGLLENPRLEVTSLEQHEAAPAVFTTPKAEIAYIQENVDVFMAGTILNTKYRDEMGAVLGKSNPEAGKHHFNPDVGDSWDESDAAKEVAAMETAKVVVFGIEAGQEHKNVNAGIASLLELSRIISKSVINKQLCIIYIQDEYAETLHDPQLKMMYMVLMRFLEEFKDQPPFNKYLQIFDYEPARSYSENMVRLTNLAESARTKAAPVSEMETDTALETHAQRRYESILGLFRGEKAYVTQMGSGGAAYAEDREDFESRDEVFDLLFRDLAYLTYHNLNDSDIEAWRKVHDGARYGGEITQREAERLLDIQQAQKDIAQECFVHIDRTSASPTAMLIANLQIARALEKGQHQTVCAEGFDPASYVTKGFRDLVGRIEGGALQERILNGTAGNEDWLNLQKSLGTDIDNWLVQLGKAYKKEVDSYNVLTEEERVKSPVPASYIKKMNAVKEDFRQLVRQILLGNEKPNWNTYRNKAGLVAHTQLWLSADNLRRARSTFQTQMREYAQSAPEMVTYAEGFEEYLQIAQERKKMFELIGEAQGLNEEAKQITLALGSDFGNAGYSYFEEQPPITVNPDQLVPLVNEAMTKVGALYLNMASRVHALDDRWISSTEKEAMYEGLREKILMPVGIAFTKFLNKKAQHPAWNVHMEKFKEVLQLTPRQMNLPGLDKDLNPLFVPQILISQMAVS